MQTHATSTTVDIELLALDLNTCTRCVGSLANIDKALDVIRPVLDATAVSARVSRIVIASEQQAREHRFAVSPTVRVAGRDIAFETLESECQSCTDLCGCDEGTSCRVWRYRGQDYTEAPVGLVVESVLSAIFGDRTAAPPDPAANAEVPENLRRFFRSASRPESDAEVCCSPDEQASCCEPEEKSVCCDDAQPETCGCV